MQIKCKDLPLRSDHHLIASALSIVLGALFRISFPRRIRITAPTFGWALSAMDAESTGHSR